jgi:hypothetical protein
MVAARPGVPLLETTSSADEAGLPVVVVVTMSATGLRKHLSSHWNPFDADEDLIATGMSACDAATPLRGSLC